MCQNCLVVQRAAKWPLGPPYLPPTDLRLHFHSHFGARPSPTPPLNSHFIRRVKLRLRNLVNSSIHRRHFRGVPPMKDTPCSNKFTNASSKCNTFRAAPRGWYSGPSGFPMTHMTYRHVTRISTLLSIEFPAIAPTSRCVFATRALYVNPIINTRKTCFILLASQYFWQSPHQYAFDCSRIDVFVTITLSPSISQSTSRSGTTTWTTENEQPNPEYLSEKWKLVGTRIWGLRVSRSSGLGFSRRMQRNLFGIFQTWIWKLIFLWQVWDSKNLKSSVFF